MKETDKTEDILITGPLKSETFYEWVVVLCP